MTTSIGFDIYAKDRASGTFNSVGDSAENSGSKLQKMGKLAKWAGLAVAGGAVLAGKALIGMTQNAIEDDAAQRKLAIGLKNATGATDGQIAAAERWIAAQGKAFGITDDELRPALQRLVEATGSVSEAQRQLGIAQDVSAGTGKSLKVVSEALMKANNGSTAALSKLGLKTKDAEGNTLSLKDALKSMSDTFGGQASAKADTLEGKMDRLKVMFDETKETIGAKLIPVLTDMGDWVLNTGVPAVQKFVQQWKDGVGLGGQLADVFGLIKDGAAGTVGFLMDHKNVLFGLIGAYVTFTAIQIGVAAVTAIQATATGAMAIITGGWTAAQWLLNAALTANPIGLVVVAIAALVAILVLAWKHSDTFRGIVTGAFDAVAGVATSAFGAIKGAISSAFQWVKNNWPLLLAILTGPIGLAVLAITRNWDTIKSGAMGVVDWFKGMPGKVGDALSSVTSKVREVFSNAMQAGKEKVVDIGGTIVGWIEGIPGKIANLGAKFGSAGRDLLQAFIDGMKNAAGIIAGIAGNVWESVRGLLNGAIDRINAALAFTINVPGPDIHFNMPDIPHLASGGRATRATLAVIGEGREPESVLPDSVLRGLLERANAAGQSSSGAGDGVPVEVHIHLEGKTIVQTVLAYKKDRGGSALGIA